jgi:outer membrane protein assembly factor BamB
VGPASRVIYLGSQAAAGNNALAVDADTGLGLWGQPLGVPVQAGPAGIFTAFGGAFDYILLGTRNSVGDSAFYALDPTSGGHASPWPYAGESGNPIGIVNSQAAADYPGQRVFFTSYQSVPGATDSVWCVSLADAQRCPGWSPHVTDGLGDVAASPTLRGARLYVAPLNGVNSEIQALDANSGSALWSARFAPADGQVKLFVVPDVFGSDLYFSTNGTVWAISDGGATAVPKWSRTTIPSPSQPVFFAGTGRVYVGGGDGKLYVLNAATGADAVPPITLGDGLSAVGAPTVDQAGGFVYVGTDAGVVYAVAIP